MTVMSHVYAVILWGVIDINPSPTAPPGVEGTFNTGLLVYWVSLFLVFVLCCRITENRRWTTQKALGACAPA